MMPKVEKIFTNTGEIMKTLILITAMLLVDTVSADPIVWNGKFYPSVELAQKNKLIPSSAPSPELAQEIGKAEKYFVGYDALVWRKRMILKQVSYVQDKKQVARLIHDDNALGLYASMQAALKLQLIWIDEQLTKTKQFGSVVWGASDKYQDKVAKSDSQP